MPAPTCMSIRDAIPVAAPHQAAESFDFTLKRRDAVRVQTVNVRTGKARTDESGAETSLCSLNKILDADLFERGGESALGLGDCRKHDLADQVGTGKIARVLIVDRTGSPQNFVGGDFARLATQFDSRRAARARLCSMPSCTNACSTGSRWRGGSPCRTASALADTGRLIEFKATSMTAATAKMPFRDSSGIYQLSVRERDVFLYHITVMNWMALSSFSTEIPRFSRRLIRIRPAHGQFGRVFRPRGRVPGR